MSRIDAVLPNERVGDRLRRVRLTALPILQSAVGAALAWAIATNPPINHDAPFFAPIAALISLGVGLGQRLTRVVELVIGVALGVLVADLLVAFIGSGPWQIGAVVALAMVVAVFLGGGAVVIAQAGTSAVLVAALLPPGSEESQLDIDRFVDATIGGLVGLVVSLLLLPVNPVTTVRKKFEPLLNKLALLLDDSAAALADRDRAAATRVLAEARQTQGDVDHLQEAIEGAAEIARIAPVRWRSRGHLVGYLDAADPVDHVTRDLRVLVRHCVVALRREEPIPAVLPQSLRTLAGSLRLFLFALEHGDVPSDARAAALVAAEDATSALAETVGLAAQTVTVQVRSLAVDVLHATGLSREEVLELLPNLPNPSP